MTCTGNINNQPHKIISVHKITSFAIAQLISINQFTISFAYLTNLLKVNPTNQSIIGRN